jgi:hypothetical protein
MIRAHIRASPWFFLHAGRQHHHGQQQPEDVGGATRADQSSPGIRRLTVENARLTRDLATPSGVTDLTVHRPRSSAGK